MSEIINQLSHSPLVRFLGPKWIEWLAFIALATTLPIIFLMVRRYMTHWRPRGGQPTQLATMVADLAKRVMRWFLIITGIWLASKSLTIDARLEVVINRLFVITAFFQMAILAIWVLDWSIERLLSSGDQPLYAANGTVVNPSAKVSQSIFRFLIRLFVVSALILSLLDNLGVEIKTLIAGLGVGGIAVALAVQNILGDLLASMSIALDRPFEVGDVITLGPDLIGTVERIGVKTTRIRSLTGEQIIANNSDMLKTYIRNFKRMAERRVVFRFGIEYETPLAKVRQIPQMIQEIIGAQENARLDRAHFATFGASSLDFEVAWYASSDNYNVYMDAQQQINLALMERLARENVNFAYPTQVLHVTQRPAAT